MLYRSEKITKQSYYNVDAEIHPKWEGVYRNVFMAALNAELDNSVNAAALMPPEQHDTVCCLSKNTQVVRRVLKKIDPRRFDLPACKTVSEEQASAYAHVLLTKKAATIL